MSTFNGRIKEYNSLAIDRFPVNSIADCFVLSHVHKDHTSGLERISFRGPLYCSSLTAKLLPLLETRKSKQLMYSHLKGCLRPIPYFEPVTVTTRKDGDMKLTFYPANHCPGASLILIEGNKGTVLYTGDMRAEPNFTRENLGTLRNFRIKNLYMDTTCCYAHKETFISKTRACDLLTDLVNSYPSSYEIYLDTWTVGYEEMWLAIKEKFNAKVHVSQQRYNMYMALDPNHSELLTTDRSSTRFHSCRVEEGCYKHESKMVTIHPVPNRSQECYQFTPSRQEKLLESDLPKDFKPYQQMILPFSTHSSLSEIVNFYHFINPKNFTPCVVHGGYSVLNGMRDLLVEHGCRVSSTPSSSEIERSNATSSSSDSSSNTYGRGTKQSSSYSTVNYASSADPQSGAFSSVNHASHKSISINNVASVSGSFSRSNGISVSRSLPLLDPSPRRSSQPLSEKNSNVKVTPPALIDSIEVSKVNEATKSVTVAKSVESSKNLNLTRSIEVSKSIEIATVLETTKSVKTARNSNIVEGAETSRNAEISKSIAIAQLKPSLENPFIPPHIPSSSSNEEPQASSVSKDMSSPQKRSSPLSQSSQELSQRKKRSQSHELVSGPEQIPAQEARLVNPNVIEFTLLTLNTIPFSMALAENSKENIEPPQYTSDSDEPKKGLTITPASTRQFLKFVSAMRKRRKRKSSGEKANPETICL